MMSVAEFLTNTARAIVNTHGRRLLRESGFYDLPNKDEITRQMSYGKSELFKMGLDAFLPTVEYPRVYVAVIRVALFPRAFAVGEKLDDGRFFQVRVSIDQTMLIDRWTMPIDQWTEDDWYALLLDGYKRMVNLLREQVAA